MNPQAIASFGGKVGTFYSETVLALPVCCLENGCVLPYSIRLTGWLLTADRTHWKPVHAAGGGKPRGFVGTFRRLLSPDCQQINIFCSLRDAMTAGAIANGDGHFCFLRPPDVVDFPFLMALDGRECRIVFPPFKSNLPWARQWGRFLHEVCETRAIPLPQATFSETIEKIEVMA
ncbi:MAG: hypothetical protein Q4D98_13780 [Planctomycetia bacterium]|nr:hypothetical protein [Planctomycetia bacterium]